MKISGNDLRPGNVIFHKGHIWFVTEAYVTQPGKGGAYNCVTLRNIRNQTKSNERFRSAEEVERLIINEKDFQYLYKSDEDFICMDLESFDQIPIKKDLFNAPIEFLQNDMILKVGVHEQEPIYANFPERITLEVMETEPVLKRQTAASSYKPATLVNGIKVSVPSHIEIGVRIVVNPLNLTYIEREKN